MHTPTLVLIGAFSIGTLALPADEADAPPLSPQEQLARFTLPPGFEIQLVASEPDIQKPLNLNFDAAGRLWVTGTGLYPLAAKTDALGHAIPQFEREWESMSGATQGAKPEPPEVAGDSVRILDNIGPDGKAGRITVFADGLNIPVGVQALPRARDAVGDTALVFSIPAIWKLEDTNGDGTADRREKLYGDFGFRDTHGMSSNYLQWTDGWIYACHGFANHSEIRDASGKLTRIHSGSTCRFRPDGSQFEIFGHGQTNPFGLTMDERGNLYSCDSHSKPAYLLLRGAHCEGIGKDHDGLGFLPPIMQHSHGSSAIAGIAHYSGEAWPQEYQNNLFIGNPVTRRINRDRLEWQGATPQAIEMPDFLSCDDPWFRPIQVKLGPDGALYIADFYNPIIGHYEHPLFDSRRDQIHGRIWRIVWKGDAAASPAPLPNLAALDDSSLVDKFTNPNLEVRRLAKLTALARGLTLPEAPREPSALLGDGPLEIPVLLARFHATPPADALTLHAIRIALRDRLSEPSAYQLTEVRDADGPSRSLLAEVSLAVPGENSARFVLQSLLQSGRDDPRAGELFAHTLRHLLPAHPDALIPLAEMLAEAPLGERLSFAEALTNAPELPAALIDASARAALDVLATRDAALLERAVPLLRASPDAAKAAPLMALIQDSSRPAGLRASALGALAPLAEATTQASEILRQPDSQPELAREAIAVLGRTATPEATAILLASLAIAPADLGVLIAAELAASDHRATRLLELIESGKASPTLLRHTLVAGNFAQRPQTLRDLAAQLSFGLPPENERLDQLIAARATSFTHGVSDLGRGSIVFDTHCAACHKFKDKGGNLAPNLDGVGASRGARRLIEDILDPSRNVDPAFRLVTLPRKDGGALTGIGLHRIAAGHRLTTIDGSTAELADSDAAGPPQTSRLSIMPAVYEQLLSEEDLHSLLHYLLQP